MLKPLLVRITPFRMSKGVIALLSPLSFHGSNILNATIHSTCPFPHCGKLECWKVRKTRPCCCNLGTQSSPDLQQRKTRIGQLSLCMRLPYCQRQQERASRVRRDHKLALRTAFAALLLVTTSVVSAAVTIQPPEVRRTAITRERLCWNDHADKSEREGTFQRKYRMKRRTFKKLVALLRPALERDYCKNSVLAVSYTFKIDL